VYAALTAPIAIGNQVRITLLDREDRVDIIRVGDDRDCLGPCLECSEIRTKIQLSGTRCG